MSDAPLGLVVMAYGTPRTPEEIEPYYTHIRRGRPPTPDLLANLQRRYDAIGGISPLAQRTEAQRAGLQAALDALEPGRAVVVLGQKHAAPFIEDGVAALVEAGVSAIVGLVLAPHYSAFSVGEYQKRVREAAPAGLPPARSLSWRAARTRLSPRQNRSSKAWARRSSIAARQVPARRRRSATI